jgi:hypothetical protein
MGQKAGSVKNMLEARAIVTTNVATFDHSCLPGDDGVSPSGRDWYLSLPQANHQPPTAPLFEGLTGVVYLEMVWVSGGLNVGTAPYGAILFQCSPRRRDEILCECVIDTAWFHRPGSGVQFVPFTYTFIANLTESLEKCHDARYITLYKEYLRSALWDTQEHRENVVKMTITNPKVWYVSYFAFTTTLNTWYNNQRLGLYKDDGAHAAAPGAYRTLTKQEFIWCFFNVALRWKRNGLIPMDNLKTALERVRVQQLIVPFTNTINSKCDNSGDQHHWRITTASDIFESAQHAV